MRPTYAEINLNNLLFNYKNISRKVNNSKVMTVVKADAYGHGMFRCVEALESLNEKKPDYYGVALLEEAIELRKSKITKQPILNFSPVERDDLKYCIKYKIISTITDFKQVEFLRTLTEKVKVHINIDTGMGRVGIHYKKAVELVLSITQNPKIEIDGIYTHFATSDEKDKTFSNLQFQRFNDVIEELDWRKIKYGTKHVANSGAILDIEKSYLDMVRCGISLYGYYPSNETSESIKLKPVMSIISRISTISRIKKNESVSYGRKFIAKSKREIASVPIGYADGIRRTLTNNMQGIIRDKLHNQVGTVTMDRIMFDVTNDNVKIGDKIILIGKSKNHQISAKDWCNVLNTIPYEITCGIGKRVPRVYKI